MVKINKVYTRTGDQGTTGLVDGSRVSKDSIRVEAYGALDELNAALGLARTWNEKGKQDPAARWLDGVLRKLQDELFDLGSELATPTGFAYPGKFQIGPKEIKSIEKLIDKCTAEIDPLSSFVLPGGGPVSGFLHLARTICRRAERVVVALIREDPEVGSRPLAYLNRLSDLLFVLSRWTGKHRGEAEYLWERGIRSQESKRAGGRVAVKSKRGGSAASASRRSPGRRKR
jgi:cob(I)alamin adenosyltransferase